MSALAGVARRAHLSGEERSGRPPWWPLAVVVYGYPVWWILGVASIMPFLMGAVMAIQLWRSQRVALPRGFVWWLLFLAWVVIGVLTLWVDAPGAVPGGGLGRLVPFGYRLLWYLTCTIFLLWLVNSSAISVPTKKIVSIVSWMFVIAAFGGLIGSLAPTLELRSALELVLPGGIRSNSFVKSLVHPGLADIQGVLGRPEARPKAPFPYANTWGSVIALTLPFFVFAWLKDGTRWQRAAAPVVLVVAAVPTVYSLNRGLWACLAVGALFAVVLQGWRGRPLRLVGTLLLLIGMIGALWVSPLGTIVSERFDNQHSNERRGSLLSETVSSAASGSPVVGFGSTRDVQGSFASIAGGGTPDCPACGVPPLGTQGHIWLVIFSQGLLGTAYFVLFFVVSFLASIRCRTPAETISTCVLIFFGIQVFVYDTLGIPLLFVMGAIGLAAREHQTRRARGEVAGQATTFRGLVEVVVRNRRAWIALMLVGVTLGAVLAAAQPRRYMSTQTVLLASLPTYLQTTVGTVDPPKEITVDTEAALVMAQQTTRAALRTNDPRASQDLREATRVTAVPNTRTINIGVVGSSADSTEARAQDLAASYLVTREEYLAWRRAQYLEKLRERQNELAALGGPNGRYLSEQQKIEVSDLNFAVGEIVLTPTLAGQVIRDGDAVQQSKPYALFGASGLALGLGAAAALTMHRENRRRRSPEG